MKNKKHLIVILVPLVIIVFGVCKLIYREYSHFKFTEIQQQYIGYTFEELVDMNKDENETISRIISYRNELYDYFLQNQFEFVEKYEEVRKADNNKYDNKLIASISLIMKNDLDNIVISFQFVDGKLDSVVDLQIYGSRKEPVEFPLKDEYEFLFKYLSFDDGFERIKNAYANYEVNWEEGVLSIPDDKYNLAIYEDSLDNEYHFDCYISYLDD